MISADFWGQSIPGSKVLEPREPWLRLLAGAEAGRFSGSGSAGKSQGGLQDGEDTQPQWGVITMNDIKWCVYIYIYHSGNYVLYLVDYNG